MSILTEIQTIVEGQRGHFDTVIADPSIEFTREAQFAMQAIEQNPSLASTAMNNQSSLKAAINNVAAIGITLNPASKLAYLVPRDGKVCLDVGYMGLLSIAQQTGAILFGQARAMYEKDEFELRGITEEPLHRCNPFSRDRGEIIGVYVVVLTDTGDYLTHTMEIGAINAIRDRTSGWKSHIKKGTSSPWATDSVEMAKKTCVKQASKYWPKRERLDKAVHYLNTDGGEGIDFNAPPEKDITPITRASGKTIVTLWKDLGRTADALVANCRTQFKRDNISSLADLTEVEAQRIIIGLRYAKQRQDPAHA